LTPANERVAHISLRGALEGRKFVTGTPARLTVPLADLCAAPGGARDRQLLMGAALLVLDRQDGWAFLRAEADGYCGWVGEAALALARASSHRVSAPATHLYHEPSVRQRELALLSLGAQVSVTEAQGNF